MRKFLPSRVAVACLLALMVPSSLRAQTKEPRVTEEKVRAVLPELERYIRDAQQKRGVPGVAVGVVYQDKVLYLKGFGVREAGKTDLVTEDTVFQIASLSKAVGSTVVAALVSDGVVSWDAKITDLDPSFQLREPYATSQLTIRDLYCHRSGLPGDAGNELEELGYPREEILRRLRYMPPAASFRSTYAYSNFGLTEGGVAAAKAAGKSWEEVSKEKLYGPLGMTHTSSLNADLLKETNVAKLHIKVDGKWTAKAVRQPDAQSPAGGVSSTAKDLVRWLQLQIGKGKFDGRQLIKADVLLETHVPQMVSGTNMDTGIPSFYALGWVTQYDAAGRTIWSHSGAFSDGARSIATIYPMDELGIVVLANAFPSGITEAVSATFFDLVHQGKPQRDHFTHFDLLVDSLFGPADRKAIQKYATPPAPVSSALGDSAYLGSYASNYLGAARVVAGKGGLVLQLGPGKMDHPLKHWNRDVFLWYPGSESPAAPSPVTFTIGSDGRASRLYIEALDINGQGTLERVP